MSFLVDTSHRSSASEMMDDFTLEGVEFRDKKNWRLLTGY